MPDKPVIGAQLSVLDIDRHRDWLFEKDRDVELPEFSLADILRAPEPFIQMAKSKLDGWNGRLGIHGPYSGFELDARDKEIRSVVQNRLDQALDVCEALSAQFMVVHSPFDQWDADNTADAPKEMEKRVSTVVETLQPAIKRAENIGCALVLENIKDVDPLHREMVREAANSPALSLSVDTGHANWAHHQAGAPKVEEFIAHSGANLGHVHLQDTDGQADRHWVLGEGNIDWPGVMASIAKCNSDPHLIVEIREFDRVQEAVGHLEALGIAQ